MGSSTRRLTGTTEVLPDAIAGAMNFGGHRSRLRKSKSVQYGHIEKSGEKSLAGPTIAGRRGLMGFVEAQGLAIEPMLSVSGRRQPQAYLRTLRSV
jgi:hypothetical protein